MNNEWTPKLPERKPHCIICGEPITSPPFIASKPKKGATMYVHTECLKHEKEVILNARERNRS